MTGPTVVIPAHDEASIIAAAVEPLAAAGLDVLVVANGCTDETAARASAAGARVIETREASKIVALNAGLADVSAYPVAVVDADVTVSPADLRALAERLDADPAAGVASPAMRVRASRSWWVRQYYRVWALTDYRSSGHIGSGVYVLDAAGAARLETFPDVIADDLYVQRLFAPAERLTPTDLTFEVEAPGSIRALLARNTRIAAGNRELASRFPALAPASGATGARSLVKRVAPRPALWAGFVIYAAVYLLAHRRAEALLAAHRPVAWNRDDTTRRASA